MRKTKIILFKYASPLELFSDDRYFSRSINMIPFNDLFEGNYLKLDVCGNMILFAPFGVYLKLYSSKQWYKLLPVAVIIFCKNTLLVFFSRRFYYKTGTALCFRINFADIFADNTDGKH